MFVSPVKNQLMIDSTDTLSALTITMEPSNVWRGMFTVRRMAIETGINKYGINRTTENMFNVSAKFDA